ncbi:MAG: hypothetical protein M1819_004582 [Sarea resinae]|nr:MAG: hypothetical protein M1819_006814 [Sarea resinae]KAI9832038.1 MAG: hypothetical protein M1819_004582 [Sarea resinae]
MQAFGAEDDDRDGPASPNGSSDNDNDETMEDADEIDGDGEADADGDAEGDNDDDNDDNDDDDDDQDEQQDPYTDSPSQSQPQSQSQSRVVTSAQSPLPHSAPFPSQGSSSANGVRQPGPTSHPPVTNATPSPRPASSLPFRPAVRPEAISARLYDIVPTIAAPHSTSINAVTATPDLRWVFSGGADGYIRKFNWVDTANGKAMLTVAQRHPFVDSVTKAGVLVSYWENEEPQVSTSRMQVADDNLPLSPVYSLATHHQGLWLLSGLESGCINLQSVRHDEGKLITSLRKHTSAISVLTLAQDEKAVLSGSWDKNVYDWDLNTGQVKRNFEGSGGQISAIETRPMSSLPVPEDLGELSLSNGTFSTNNDSKPLTNGLSSNTTKSPGKEGSRSGDGNIEDAHGSPTDSLFGGNEADSLFGDDNDAGAGAPSGGNFGDDDDDEFSRAIANGIQQQEQEDAQGDVSMVEAGGPVQPPSENIVPSQADRPEHEADGTKLPNGMPPQVNGLPHSNDDTRSTVQGPPSHEPAQSPDSTFLAASIDGTIRIWDRRQPNPVSVILPRNTPPWCMNACWSPDGNFIYAGRRNGTVEEYSLHKGLRDSERTFKFPQGSGPVSAVRAMPNGRHMIW